MITVNTIISRSLVWLNIVRRIRLLREEFCLRVRYQAEAAGQRPTAAVVLSAAQL